ncbi:pyridoxal phosphate-dependent aminotransferase [Aminipila luticellarii]|uniref:Aminotransferase n=1 Tax=Aminipila luticellarii TaxID=2507160 RepID=A0A410PU77_9FIRM|nr:pyridoxal phosphate-dependent aminotransferase [Aminipila luticellarii]QAT42428.1 pyridoxal phosphate-dependent aminotransferase [Aminipila luticellarii]
MIAKSMESYVKGSSAIRAMFEEGGRLAKIYGKENVYDFSLGNPNVEPPEEIRQSIIDILQSEEPTFVHGYMNNAGYEDVRNAIAQHLNKQHGTQYTERNILMTAGAAGGLNVILKTLIDPEDEVIVFAPYFGEYRSYAANYGAELVVIPPNLPTFQPDLKKLAESITAKTKALIINSPNNPTGVIYSEETIKKIAEILTEKEKEFAADIYVISDEPYRELVYDGAVVPYIPQYYKNTVIGYSYSKSLSLPGERIGYLVMPDELSDFDDIVSGATTANRILGFVNAPSIMQRAVARCINSSVNIDVYNKNREALYNGLIEMGYECAKPEGAFYLFVKSPIEDEAEFCDMAKEHRVLIVPGSSFACPGYVRMAYCVSYDTITGALPQMQEVMNEIKSSRNEKQ